MARQKSYSIIHVKFLDFVMHENFWANCFFFKHAVFLYIYACDSCQTSCFRLLLTCVEN